jgi:hypothetical protein
MALRIEKAFGPDMDHLLRMQLAYDVAQTRAISRDDPVSASCCAGIRRSVSAGVVLPELPGSAVSRGSVVGGYNNNALHFFAFNVRF